MVGSANDFFLLPELHDQIFDSRSVPEPYLLLEFSVTLLSRELLDEGVTAFAESFGQSVAHQAQGCSSNNKRKPWKRADPPSFKEESLPSAIMAPHSGVGGDTPR